MPDVDGTSTRSPSCGKRCCGFFRKCLPRLILIIAYIVYLLLGGLVFSFIEEPRYKELAGEQHDNEESAEATKEFIMEAFLNRTSNDVKPDSEEIDELLLDLLHAAEHPELREGPDNETVILGEEWTFGNAVLFCMTTTSTIGYGHLIPHTGIGKVLCLFYTFFGIPLTLLILGDLGRLSAANFTKTYNKCLMCCCKSRRRRALARRNSIRKKKPEDNADGNGGEGEPNGEVKGDQVLDLSEASASPARNASPAEKSDEPVQTRSNGNRLDSDAFDETDLGLTAEVPLFVTIMIFWTYIIFSAPMFSMIEGWSFSTSFYFLFISITTVGFGDLVPRSSMGLVSAWMGLVVTSMCISLSYRKLLRFASTILNYLDSLINEEKKDVHYSNI